MSSPSSPHRIDRVIGEGPLPSWEKPQLISEADLAERGPGRPPAITRETADNLIHLVESGFTIDQACAVEGVGRSTVARYLSTFSGFREALTRARRNRVLKIARLHEEAMEVAAATGDWRAIHVRFESELRQLEREFSTGSVNMAVDDTVIDVVTEAVQRRLSEGAGDDPPYHAAGDLEGSGTADHDP